MDALTTALYNLGTVLDEVLNETDFPTYKQLLDNDLIDDAVLLDDAVNLLIEKLEKLA